MIYQGKKLMNKNFIIVGAILLVVGLAVAIGVSLVDEPLDGNLPEGETTISGDALPEYAGENDINISVGLQAPSFSGPDQNSEIISLEKNGKSKILLFLAHWCPHCQAEVPVVQEYIDTFGLPADVEVIGILTSIDRSRNRLKRELQNPNQKETTGREQKGESSSKLSRQTSELDHQG
jgi:thiol-disulfide isomerase/thioredoxin